MQGNSLWTLIEGVADYFAQVIFCMLQLPCFHCLLPTVYGRSGYDRQNTGKAGSFLTIFHPRQLLAMQATLNAKSRTVLSPCSRASSASGVIGQAVYFSCAFPVERFLNFTDDLFLFFRTNRITEGKIRETYLEDIERSV